MRLRLFLLSFAIVNLSCNGIEQAMTAQSQPRSTVLSAEDMMRILPGHTLLAYDNGAPFWMYYPSPGIVWGRSSNGDVDIGRWWTEKDRYCRTWRHWYGGAPQCWNLASLGEDRIAWIDEDAVRGETLLQSGNTIGAVLPRAQLASLPTELDIDAASLGLGIGPEPRKELSDRQAAQGGNRSGSSSGDPAGGGGSSGGSGGSSGGGSSSGTGGSGGGSGGGDGGSDGGSHGKGEHGGKHDRGDRGGKGGKGKD